MIVEAKHFLRPDEIMRFDTSKPEGAYRVNQGEYSSLPLDWWAKAYVHYNKEVPWLVVDPDLILDEGL